MVQLGSRFIYAHDTVGTETLGNNQDDIENQILKYKDRMRCFWLLCLIFFSFDIFNV